MTNKTHPHRFAGTAIAAVLALGSTPLWAQESTPIGEQPASVVVPATQPAIVLPPVTAAPAEPAITAPVPEPTVAAPVVARTAPRAGAEVARPASTRAAASVAQAEPIAAAPVAVSAGSVTTAETIATEQTPIEEPLVEETAIAAPADDNSSSVLPLAGLLAAIGLGGIGLYAARRRRRQPDEVQPTILAREPAVAIPPRPIPTRAVQPMPSPTPVAPAMALRPTVSQNAQGLARPAWQEPRRADTAPASTQARQLNREALLVRMVAAQPDANNPFTSAQARRRRARLMLQSMDNQRWDDAELAPGFDWREQARGARARETVSA